MEAKTEPQKRTIPAKALYFADMHFITNGPAVLAAEPSANAVRRVNFTTADGQELLGFYKPLSDIYPELLAKYCVAISVAGRMCLGEAVSDERLVFDKGKIVGTVSVAIPGFADPSRKPATELSTEEILNTNIIEILVWMMFIQNDDFHPNNISRVDVGNENRRGKAAVFDFDLCLRGAGLSAVKTPRYAELAKELLSWTGRDQDFSLKPEHLSQFPKGFDATYWPPRDYPGNLNIAKVWANWNAFAKLNSKEFAARTYEQMYSAILKIFMLSDSRILEARLKEAFAETLLDFQDAPNNTKTDKAGCASKLMEKAPLLFTTATDREPFYKHFLAMYKQILDHWQNIVFSFKDPRISSELLVSAPRFCDFLSQNHMARTDVLTFIKQENNNVMPASTTLGDKPAPLGCLQFTNNARLSESSAERRFLFSWWASHTEHRKTITDQIGKLIALIEKDLIFPFEGSTSSHHSDPQNPLAQAKEKLCAFRNKVQALEEACSKHLKAEYQPNPIDSLTASSEKDAITQFCEDLLEARGNLFKDLRLGNGNQYKAEGATLSQHILDLATLLHNPTVAIPRRASKLEPLTDAEAKERLFREFLSWLRNIDQTKQGGTSDTEPYSKSFFLAHVSEALKSYKDKARVQERCEKIEKYTKLAANAESSITDSLAFIMSHGGMEATSLNTFLFCNLIRQFQESNITTHDYSVSSLLPSLGVKQENLDLREKYLGFFQTQFLYSQEFEHYFSAKSRAFFMRALKEWLAFTQLNEINTIISHALTEYSKGQRTIASAARTWLSMIHVTPALRDNEVKDIMNKTSLTAIQKVAKIWSSGKGWENNSFNTILFQTLLGAMDSPENKRPLQKKTKDLISWLLKDGYDFLSDFIELLKTHNKLLEIDRIEAPPLTILAAPSESSMSL